MTKDLIEKNELPFAKAYDFIRKRKDIKAAEKLAMFEICRYWPDPYWGNNFTISQNIGFTERYTEKLIEKLVKKKIIYRHFAHKTIYGKPYTKRIIVPLCFPEKSKPLPEQQDGKQPNTCYIVPEQQSGQNPNTCSNLLEQQDDLIESNKKNNKKENNAMPAPLPAIGQASALPIETAKQDFPKVDQFKKAFKLKPLQGKDLEDRKKEIKRQGKLLNKQSEMGWANRIR